jgi:hypothetical protein
LVPPTRALRGPACRRVLEAKPEEWGHRITTVEDQTEGYATATLTIVGAARETTLPLDRRFAFVLMLFDNISC